MSTPDIKMKKLTSLYAFAALLPAAAALGGFDEFSYVPMCAEACGRNFWPLMLDCSDPMDGHAGHNHGNMTDNTPMTSAACLAGNEPYLTSLAWCIHVKCEIEQPDVRASTIEDFWEKAATQDPASNMPKWTFGEAVRQVREPPTRVWQSGEVLNYTALWNETIWEAQVKTLSNVNYHIYIGRQYA